MNKFQRKLAEKMGEKTMTISVKDWDKLKLEQYVLKEKYKDLLDTKTQVHMRAMMVQQKLDKLKYAIWKIPKRKNKDESDSDYLDRYAKWGIDILMLVNKLVK